MSTTLARTQIVRVITFDTKRAACRDGALPGVFAAAAEQRPSALRTSSRKLAREACDVCPLLDACRAYAVRAAEPWGVWGGTLPSERMAS
jgi:WhiB family redox-sensing transcriptional regulator